MPICHFPERLSLKCTRIPQDFQCSPPPFFLVDSQLNCNLQTARKSAEEIYTYIYIYIYITTIPALYTNESPTK